MFAVYMSRVYSLSEYVVVLISLKTIPLITAWLGTAREFLDWFWHKFHLYTSKLAFLQIHLLLSGYCSRRSMNVFRFLFSCVQKMSVLHVRWRGWPLLFTRLMQRVFLQTTTIKIMKTFPFSGWVIFFVQISFVEMDIGKDLLNFIHILNFVHMSKFIHIAWGGFNCLMFFLRY